MVGGVGRYGIFSFLLSSLPSSLVAAASPPRFHPLRLHALGEHAVLVDAEGAPRRERLQFPRRGAHAESPAAGCGRGGVLGFSSSSRVRCASKLRAASYQLAGGWHSAAADRAQAARPRGGRSFVHRPGGRYFIYRPPLGAGSIRIQR